MPPTTASTALGRRALSLLRSGLVLGTGAALLVSATACELLFPKKEEPAANNAAANSGDTNNADPNNASTNNAANSEAAQTAACRDACEALTTDCQAELLVLCTEQALPTLLRFCRDACVIPSTRTSILAALDMTCAQNAPSLAESFGPDALCVGGVERCDDALDNDLDGATDCADSDCEGVPICSPNDPVPLPAPDETLTLEGSLTATDTVWVRPTATCTAGSAGDYFFDRFILTNPDTLAHTIDLTADWNGTSADGFLHVFANTFDLSDLDRCIAGNDDFDGATTSRVTGIRVDAGGSVIVVASTRTPGRIIDDYTIEIATRPLPESDCDNADDDDNNGVTDCDDAACAATTACAADATPLPEPGASTTLDGSLSDDDPTWTRPGEGCADNGSAGPAFFDFFALTNTSDAARTFSVTAAWSGTNADGFLHAFTTPFRADSFAGCLKGDDDGPSGAASSRLDDLTLDPGQTLLILASSFAPNTPIGAYTLTVETNP